MPDLPMVWEYLALPNLGKRLVAAVQAGFLMNRGLALGQSESCPVCYPQRAPVTRKRGLRPVR
ncbi:hypothetical protein [Acaryochloris sp. CCMEE 5410]|uniref:hypothetical protein n=1 Tax=Acaryochloris sp. CCMEE 5410 TaxID=310037 RepID=UPI0021D001C2|nr:hypothetical protein [Acaryochloris sp. CCMEE 5410]KAI9129128.1 hypothetical protein ON05_036355 [Acaryochloris sp. CCMEE 5410]